MPQSQPFSHTQRNDSGHTRANVKRIIQQLNKDTAISKDKDTTKNASHVTTTSKRGHNSVIKNQTKPHQRKSTRFLFNIMPIMFQIDINKKAVLRHAAPLKFFYQPRFNTRAIDFLSSRSLIDCRLSNIFLPLAIAITTLASPRSLINTLKGIIEKPGC